MCHLTMDTSLVKVWNTITLATYQAFFFIVIDFVLNYPKLSKLVHCLVSLTCTEFNVKIQDLSYTEQMIWSYARNMSSKSYGWKNYVVDCCGKQNPKFFSDIRSCWNANGFACERSESANLKIQSKDLDLNSRWVVIKTRNDLKWLKTT